MNKYRIRAKAVTLFSCLMLSQTVLWAQDAHKISIKKEKLTLKEALKEVEKQSKTSIAYNESQLGANKVISLNLSDATLDTALSQILKGTGFSYRLEGNYVILQPVEKQQKGKIKQVSGQIIDESQMPMIGVNVMIKGKPGVGTITDFDGNFSLEVAEGDVLEVSYVGYATQDVKVQASNVYNLTMKADTEVLEEVVVTALGIKRKSKALGYNLTELKSDEVTAVKDANFVNSLTGKVAGLQINSSGGIGGSTKVVMRGAKSISKSNNVLYVIDGVPLNNTNGGDAEAGQGFFTTAPKGEGIADINPEDIESMSVLTGPSAAALYGSNAANGAILITTKKGAAGKPKITLAHNTDFSKPFVLPRFQNTYGNKPGEFTSWGEKLDTPSDYDPSDFFRTGYNTTTSLSISLGTEKNQTFASASTTASEGIIPNNKYQRHNFTVRNSTNFFDDRMTMDLGFSYVLQKDQNMMSQGQYFNPLVPVYLFPRGEDFTPYRMFERYDEGRQLMTQYWPYGEMGMTMQNPYWITERNMFNNDRDRYMANAGLKYKVFDWLDISGRVRIDNAITRHTKKLYAGTDAKLSQSKGYYGDYTDIDRQTYADVLMNINKRFNEFDLTANIGASIQDIRYERNGAEGQLSMIPNFFTLHNVDLNANNSRIKQDGWKEQTQSVFASAELGWRSMVYLSATARNDWASALQNTPNTSFFYPSIGLSGVITEMVKLPEWLTFWKVRGSYSSVGNAPSRYLTIPTYGYNSNGEFQTNTHMPIPELEAERTKSFEIGTNMKFFNGKLGFDFTYYKSNTYNQTFEAKASPSSGYSTFFIQAGDIENWGIESMLSYEDNFGGVNWSSQLTFSMNRNRINELVRNYPDPTTGELISIPSLEVAKFGTYRMILEEGGSMGDLYVTNRLREDGNGFIYVDPDSNQLQTVEELQKVGNANPDFNLGFRNSFSWKGVSLGFLISARIGGEVMSATQAILDRFGVSEASAIARDNGGVPVNFGKMDAQYFYEYIGNGDTGMLSNYVYSATNVRLQELTIGYNLPKKWFNEKVDMTVSFVGRNLWMIYNKAPFDPEAIAFTGTYYQGLDYFMQPSMRNVGFSVRMNF
ncbi:TonB-dependent receptor [Phocaeicola sp. HCN-40430]|uniref:TonB-dependent receptor n=1 Tax=Phocaeicola sp. HCN-40430 TaxID=3134664 RepID=UPI0030BBB041